VGQSTLEPGCSVLNKREEKFGNMPKTRISKPDRRVQKTKKLLTEALIELILEKGYEQTTVQDILDRANVGRATFYTHYENKDLLLVDGHRNLGLDFLEESVVYRGKGGGEADFTALLEHVAANLPLGKALLGKKGGDIFVNALRERLSVLIQARYRARPSRSRSDLYRARAAAAAIASLVASWVDDDLPLTTDEMNELARAAAKI
jgi:AcrR family transcriptional regulator